MGITASYRRLTSQRLSELQNDPEEAEYFFGIDLDDSDFERYFTLEKDWHALHFLITGDSSLSMEDTQALPPHCNVVLGGAPTQFEASYGFVRFLTPEEVRAVAELLSTISAEDLRRRFDPRAFNAARIYPNPSPRGWDEEQLELLLEIYPEFVQFFQKAAEEGDVVLLSNN